MSRARLTSPDRHASSPATRLADSDRARDISALAWTLLLIGLAALAGALVLPDRPPMLAPMAGALALVGLGLLRRAPWSRTTAIALFAALIHGQLSRRWLESDLIHPFIDALSGVHHASAAMPMLSAPVVSSSLGLAGAVSGALLCLVMGCFGVRLASRAVRCEFQPRTQVRRGVPTWPSR
ncbi:hypothetical protein [Sphaerotilus mobilis]|uniref:Uncharacterized protein n=1 Tax=Sphaerotilus mobilis TaxID=47994 RepID=A0A4Q7LT06_9BURK|nr:hypothetical protein [Sphaerotilus mobilis]RZS58055.1 hypothetical protein EV685_0332 [Sphaerotilus mobilis]